MALLQGCDLRQIRFGLVDPGSRGDGGCGWSAVKAVGVGRVGVVEDGLAVSADRCVVAAVDAGWGVVADAGVVVVVVVVVVVEELVGERSGGVGQAGESLRESWGRERWRR
jgi:hypothetical protein